jgi:hypothetical protein
VRFAGRKERELAEFQRAICRASMHTEAGRAWNWQIIEWCHVNESIWRPSAEIHYLAGQQDIGHRLQMFLLSVDEELYQLMEKEARARMRARNREIDATHTPRAATQE